MFCAVLFNAACARAQYGGAAPPRVGSPFDDIRRDPFDERFGAAASSAPRSAHHARPPAAQQPQPPPQHAQPPPSSDARGACGAREGTRAPWPPPSATLPADNNSESEEDEDAVPGTPPDSPLAAKRARM